MKKLVYLIPIIALASCVGTQEVYDDVYTRVEVEEPANPENEDLGYADYIKNSEGEYEVEVDSSAVNNGGVQNGAYYTNNGDINVHNYGSGAYADPYWGGGTYNNYNFYGGSYGFNRAWPYRYNRWGWSIRYNPVPYWGIGDPFWGWGGNPYWGWAGNSYWGWGGNPYWGWGGNPYGGWGGNPYWGFGGNPYWGCGNSFWGNPYNSPGAWSGGGFADNGGATSNVIYGHRGAVQTNSSNSTAYEHTVKSQVNTGGGAATQPFDLYDNDQATVTTGLQLNINDKPAKNGGLIDNGSGTAGDINTSIKDKANHNNLITNEGVASSNGQNNQINHGNGVDQRNDSNNGDIIGLGNTANNGTTDQRGGNNQTVVGGSDQSWDKPDAGRTVRPADGNNVTTQVEKAPVNNNGAVVSNDNARRTTTATTTTTTTSGRAENPFTPGAVTRRNNNNAVTNNGNTYTNNNRRNTSNGGYTTPNRGTTNSGSTSGTTTRRTTNSNSGSGTYNSGNRRTTSGGSGTYNSGNRRSSGSSGARSSGSSRTRSSGSSGSSRRSSGSSGSSYNSGGSSSSGSGARSSGSSGGSRSSGGSSRRR